MAEKLHNMLNNIKKNSFMSGVTNSVKNIIDKHNNTEVKQKLEEKGAEIV